MPESSMRRLPDGWSLVPFERAATPVRGLPGKVLARDYAPTGRFLVIDQGAGQIAGFTDDQTVAIKDGFPYIVFGDHTRAFKFVDFPFALGADGTQLLKSSDLYDSRFLYYVCRSLEIPSRGYNRHFSVLKEQDLVCPPLREQEQISVV